MFKRILVPLDGSRLSAKALPYGIEIAKRFDAELILVQVVEAAPSHGRVPAGVSTAATGLAKEAALTHGKRDVTHARRYLAEKLSEAAAQGVTGSFHVLTGDPARSIIQFCKKHSVDLVVMTTSGKSGIKRAVLGSVADKLVRDPSVPELVIRPEMKSRNKTG